MNNEVKGPEDNLDRAIEFLENRKIESLKSLTTEVERKDLSKEFEKGIQVLKDRKKKLMNIQKLTEKKKMGTQENEMGRKYIKRIYKEDINQIFIISA